MAPANPINRSKTDIEPTRHAFVPRTARARPMGQLPRADRGAVSQLVSDKGMSQSTTAFLIACMRVLRMRDMRGLYR